MQELDLTKDAIFPQKSSPAAQNRYVYYPDHLVRMPHPSFGFAANTWNLLTEPVFSGAIKAMALEHFQDKRSDTMKDESVGDFFSRRFSRSVVDRILSAVLHGIYAGDAWQLSVKSLFPSLWRAESHGSIVLGMLQARAEGIQLPKREVEYLRSMRRVKWDPLLKATLKDSTVFTFRDGLSMLIDRLARKLYERENVEFRTSSPIDAIALTQDGTRVSVNVKDSQKPELYTHAISTLSPWHLNLVHKPATQDDAEVPTTLVPDIPSVTVMTVNLYFRTPDLNPPGFGYVIPQATPFENNPERALGVVFDTAYSPSPQDADRENWQVQSIDELKQARDQGQLVNVNDFAWYNMPERLNMQDDVKVRGTKLTVMLGGHWWNGWPSYPNEQEGLALAKSVVQRHLGITEEPEVWQVNMQTDCIPQYTVGHEERLQTAHANISKAYNGRLRVAGSWMSGVGVNDCLRSAWDVVNGLEAGTQDTGLGHIGANDYVQLKLGDDAAFS